jgi:hypothetical protein
VDGNGLSDSVGGQTFLSVPTRACPSHVRPRPLVAAFCCAAGRPTSTPPTRSCPRSNWARRTSPPLWPGMAAMWTRPYGPRERSTAWSAEPARKTGTTASRPPAGATRTGARNPGIHTRRWAFASVSTTRWHSRPRLCDFSDGRGRLSHTLGDGPSSGQVSSSILGARRSRCNPVSRPASFQQSATSFQAVSLRPTIL